MTRVIGLVCAVILIAGQANAVSTTYTDRSTFEADNPGLLLED